MIKTYSGETETEGTSNLEETEEVFLLLFLCWFFGFFFRE